MSNTPTVNHLPVSSGAIGFGGPSMPGFISTCYSSACYGLLISDDISWTALLIISTVSCHAAALKHPRTPPANPSLDYPSGDSDHVTKRTRPMGICDEVIICFSIFKIIIIFYYSSMYHHRGLFSK